MIFITGPLFAGKRDFACRILNCKAEELARYAAWDVQELVGQQTPEELAEQLKTWPVVIATEVGGGVVPVDAKQRADREAAGRLACLLAQKADTVVRVFCGLPILLKGELPE